MWGKGGLVRWSVVKAPVMFLDEPMTNLKVLQRDPAHDGPVDIELAAGHADSILDGPIKRFGLHDGDAVALVGLKTRPAIIVGGVSGRSSLCVPTYSFKPSSGPKAQEVAALRNPSLFPVPEMAPVLELPGYARPDRLFIAVNSMLTPNAIEVEVKARKVLEGLLFGQFTAEIPSWIE